MDKLLLVDGSNLLFQMFFGMPARIVNRSGKAIHGTMGFVGALFKIIRMTNPTHIAVLFDGEHENTRTDLNADYKANRTDYSTVDDKENPFSQLDDIYAALDYLHIQHAETTVCETDDWIAGYALTYGQAAQIVISSFDSDYFQLLTDNVSQLRYRGAKSLICTPEYLLNRFGVLPEHFADFKALAGDSSDNLKGADKVGPKTAARLISKFGTLDSVIANAERIDSPSVKASVIKNAKRVQTNYELIKLTNKAKLPFPLDELVFRGVDSTTRDTLKGIGLLP